MSRVGGRCQSKAVVSVLRVDLRQVERDLERCHFVSSNKPRKIPRDRLKNRISPTDTTLTLFALKIHVYLPSTTRAKLPGHTYVNKGRGAV